MRLCWMEKGLRTAARWGHERRIFYCISSLAEEQRYKSSSLPNMPFWRLLFSLCEFLMIGRCNSLNFYDRSCFFYCGHVEKKALCVEDNNDIVTCKNKKMKKRIRERREFHLAFNVHQITNLSLPLTFWWWSKIIVDSLTWEIRNHTLRKQETITASENYNTPTMRRAVACDRNFGCFEIHCYHQSLAT